MFDSQNLKESSEFMRDSVMNFVELIGSEDYSQRIKTYQDGCYYAEIAKDYERSGIVKIDKNGRILLAEKGKAKWVLSNFISEGAWNPIKYEDVLLKLKGEE